MITGVHAVIFTGDAEQDRAFFRDVLELPFAALPKSEDIRARRARGEVPRKTPPPPALAVHAGVDPSDPASVTPGELAVIVLGMAGGLGTAAAEALLRMIEKDGAPPPGLTLPVELVVRDSTGPHRSKAAAGEPDS